MTGPAEEVSSIRVLLVEDDEVDARRVRRDLESVVEVDYRISWVHTLDEALQRLRELSPDVILLDLHLPGYNGVETSVAMVEAADDVPVVVLTGHDDEAMARQCIDRGALDYLKKDEADPLLLRRTLGYALAHVIERRHRRVAQRLEQYRTLSQRDRGGAEARHMPFRERAPHEMEVLRQEYRELLEAYLECLTVKSGRPADRMRWIIQQLGDLGGGPRDLVEVHLAALHDATSGAVSRARQRAYTVEGRLLALEMMGYLVDYYRTEAPARNPVNTGTSASGTGGQL